MKTKNNGFSLLEMLTVMVIIAIISSLLISGVNAHKKAVLVAKTRMQFVEYESAINMYCREYGDLPYFFRDEETVALNEGTNSETFIKILSGKTASGESLSAEEQQALNPKGKNFHTFGNSEFFLKADNTRDHTSIADAFNNTRIFIIVEDPFDNDTIISKGKFPEQARKYVKGDGVKNAIAIFSISEDGRTVVSNCFDQYF
ncbi:MAG: prepilin-type N-terminal cleavage/methylation domain-containing protein [Puniceicoccales bacterium]|jgi:prepilin-type N-terminal cleavage/methylation domain-containing protein|nr:prepilin-type N-terminal cleavage/methylation domain-containing protein [Puniceicoccales bacterium]